MGQTIKMNKYVLIVLSVIMLAVFAGVGFFIYNKKVRPEIVNQVGITAEECAKRGGEIVNILDDERADNLEFRQDHKDQFCKNSEDYLNDIVGLRCPCICCKKPTSSSFGNDQLEKFITDYLLTQKYFSWKTTVDSRNFCVIENLNPTEDGLFPLYVWVRCGEFILQNGKLKELSGSSGPAKINYPNELSYRDLSKMSHEAPRDGSLYPKEIKTIFPLNAQRQIVDFNIADLNKKIESIALSGFGNTYNPVVPVVFNLIFRYSVDAKNELDTFKQTYTKDMVMDPPVTIKFKLLDNELAGIYQEINDRKLFDMTDESTDEQMFVTPCSSYYLKVQMDSVQKELSWDDCRGKVSDRLKQFTGYIISIIESKEEYKKLPAPRGGYL